MNVSRISVRTKLFVLVTSVVAVAFVLTFTFFIYREVDERWDVLGDEVNGLTAVLASQLDAYVAFSDKKNAEQTLSALSSNAQIREAVVLLPDGVTFALYLRHGESAAIRGILPGTRIVNGDVVTMHPISSNGETLGWVGVRRDSTEVMKSIREALTNGAYGLLLALVTSGIVLSILSSRFLKPVLHLAAVATRVRAERDFTLRANVDVEDEMGTLADAFNDMLQQIEQREVQLEKHSALLEKTVEERTSELVTARNAAEQALRIKSQFLTNMSHELRTPLNGIVGTADLLVDSPLNSEQKDLVETVQKSAVTLLGLINDILDLSRLEAGKLELETIPFSAPTIAEDVADLLAPVAQRKQLEIVTRADREATRAVLGDPARLKQVLMNLVGNAIKFTSHGAIELSVRSTTVNESEVELTFSVRDSGIGIGETELERLFRPFSQADASTTRRFGGTGLGLAISQRLVDAMGSKLKVQSREGVGSTFFFSLTLAIAPSAPLALPIPLQRALFVCREIALADALVQTVEGAGGCAGSSASIEEAIESIHFASDSARPIEVLFIDYELLDGASLRKLQANHSALRVVALQPLSLRGHVDQVPCDGVLTKPVHTNRLLTILGAPSDERVHDPIAQTPQNQRSLRILIAEDNEVNQKIALRMVQKLGHTGVLAENGRVAVEAASTGAFDLILMDCHMPELDGYCATQSIRKLPGPAAKQTIVALTASALPGDRERCLEAGMDGYLAKPFNLDALRRVIASVVDNTPEAPADIA